MTGPTSLSRQTRLGNSHTGFSHGSGAPQPQGTTVNDLLINLEARTNTCFAALGHKLYGANWQLFTGYDDPQRASTFWQSPQGDFQHVEKQILSEFTKVYGRMQQMWKSKSRA